MWKIFFLRLDRLYPGFPLSLGDLGDLGDQKYFYQWNSEKRKWNFNGFPIFPWNQVHFIQSNSDNGNNKTNAFPILRTTFWMHFQLSKDHSIDSTSHCWNQTPYLHTCEFGLYTHQQIFCSSPSPNLKVSSFVLIITTQV